MHTDEIFLSTSCASVLWVMKPMDLGNPHPPNSSGAALQ